MAPAHVRGVEAWLRAAFGCPVARGAVTERNAGQSAQLVIDGQFVGTVDPDDDGDLVVGSGEQTNGKCM